MYNVKKAFGGILMKKLGFGLMRLPLTNPSDSKSIDINEFCKMTDAFIEKGFTYFDTAYMYHDGKSECAVKEALVKRYPRDSFTLTDKMPVWYLKEKEDMQRIFDDQCERCGVDYFDYYLVHSLDDENYALAQKFGAFDFVANLQKQGKVKTIGFSFHGDDKLLERILKEHPEMQIVQLQINYLDWESEKIQSRRCYEIARRYNKPVIIMEPVKGGRLADLPEKADKLLKAYNPDVSAASWAIRFAASHDGVMTVLSGMSDMTQLNDNTGYMQNFEPLNNDEQEIIKQVTEIIKSMVVVDCTGCEYCVSGCPMNIAIPKYFSVYNKKVNKEKGLSVTPKEQYEELKNTFGSPKDCIACGQCESHCPQHLQIIQNLRLVADMFE